MNNLLENNKHIKFIMINNYWGNDIVNNMNRRNEF